MVRLPQPGSDEGAWGEILNEFLAESHKPDGKLKDELVADTTLVDGAVTNAKLDNPSKSALNKANSSVQSVNGVLPNGSGLVTLIPGDIGAPTTLETLDDVDALGAVTDQVLAYNQGTGKWTAATITSTTVNDASNSGKGIIQLAGDLGGSNDPTNPTISIGAITGAKIANTTITDANISASAAIVQTKIQNLVADLASKEPTITATTSADYYRGDKTFQTLNKSAVGLGNVDNTSDANKPVSTAQQTALNLKSNSASPTFTGTVTVPTPVNPTDATTKTYVDTTAAAAAPDATTLVKGKVQLAGDLAGTAALPTVPGLTGKEPTITATTSADYYRGDKTFQTLNKAAVGLANVDNTSDATKNSTVATLTNKTLTSPVVNSPTGIVKADVGLGNVDNTSDVNKPISTATQSALDAKVAANIAITGATKTKVTYDTKGLVTAGADATTADIADSTNKRYVTDANLTVIGNTSGTNSGDNATNTQYSGLAASKENTITATTSADYYRGDKTFQTLNKTAVGLANVDNTSDVNKPVSTATQTAILARHNYAGQVRVNYTGLTLINFTANVAKLLVINSATPTVVGSPTTTWPFSSPTTYDPTFYNSSTDRLRENNLPGQAHMWRINGTYANKAAGNTGRISVELFNPDSGFVADKTINLPSGLTGDTFTVDMVTIADAASLAAGRGYQVSFNASFTDNNLTIDAINITRVSFAVEIS